MVNNHAGVEEWGIEDDNKNLRPVKKGVLRPKKDKVIHLHCSPVRARGQHGARILT